MALTGLEIFKMTPKKNCKECGFPTCMAFAMKVASGAAAIEKCPHISAEAKDKLAEATAPLMRTVRIGAGDAEKTLGGETVMFRHEKTFVSKTLFAVQFSDALSADVVAQKMENIRKVDYVRIGEQMHVELVAVKYAGNRERYLELVGQLKALDKIFVLVCDDADVAAAAAELVKETKPVLVGANESNLDAMVALAKEHGIALGLNAESVEEMYALAEKAQQLGYRELLLNVGTASAAQAFANAVAFRRTALVGQDRTLGYPSLVFVNELAKGDAYLQTALAACFLLKYGSIVVLDDI
ncbi:MAG TPA: acetyl-CoA decarbonylase/synthase complex subunit gamma, partial [Firmicutes bacterium]|nr:acetyl-CoA decarbonylase/synthase complex subunit gamma [Bacillota bacterium]